MSDHTPFSLTRRGLLAGGGALVVTVSLARPLPAQTGGGGGARPSKPAPGSLAQTRRLDAWVRIGTDGAITVFTGKAELGQGIRTALLQVAAEELRVPPAAITLVTADTARTPNEGYTAGSQSMQNSGTAIRAAAAQARTLLAEEAARRFGAPADALGFADRRVTAPDGRSLGYGELAASLDLTVDVPPDAPLTAADRLSVMGRPLPRVDIPAKVTGGAAYAQDLRLEGMLHARVVRPPSPAARLTALDAAGVEAMPGVAAVLRDGNFLAVVADKEYRAVKAMRALAAAARWEETATLPGDTPLPDLLRGLEREVGTVDAKGEAGAIEDGPRSLRARFTRPYQLHGSIGPSCGVAVMGEDGLTVWSHTQGVYPDRKAIAEMLRLPVERVRVIHTEGSGCYGHNGADDAAADAALIASKLPGRPVRVQWMREQEHAGEPYGPAMMIEAAASLDGNGRIDRWTFDVWSNTHTTRPGGAGALLAARHLAEPFPAEPAAMQITPAGNGDRNAIPLYAIPNTRVLWHFLPDMPLRVSALRSLGAYANVFALESMMDDLALLAGADPVEFRLRHLEDPRARRVVELAAERFGWTGTASAPGFGHGFAFARYKNHAAYLALAVELSVDRGSGRVRMTRATAAIDSGEIVNPDGIRNQTEGGIIQAMSWTLFERVAYDNTRVTSVDWASYPILRFASVPDRIDVHIVERPGDPFLGTGEAAQGPTAAAIGNAIRSATGRRLRDLPFTPDRVRESTATG
ncbi:molybdopterin cofactor-binding domain-containing protein [Azospirillum argentinense]